MEILGVAWEMYFIYLLLFLIFLSFILEKIPADITAMGGMIILIMFGILERDDALEVFSNSAPITIGAMFIISAALERTGCIQVLGKIISRYGGKSELSLMLTILPVVLIISAFMNNTPVVIVLTPVIIGITRKLDLASSKLLIPLSYAAILGGTCTLIGTSTNLLVNGIAVEQGEPAFNMFDITLPGLFIAAAGFIYMLFIGRHMLPVRQSLQTILGNSSGKNYIAQLLVPENSKLVDQRLSESDLKKGEDTRIIDVIRHGDSMREFLEDLKIKAGDRVILESNTSEILGIKETGMVKLDNNTLSDLSPIDASEVIVAEGIVANGSTLIGKLTNGLGLRDQYGVYMMGYRRQHHGFFSQRNANTIQNGDALLLEGPAIGMQKLFEETGLVNLTIPEERPIRRHKAPIALLTLILVVGLAAIDVMPISLLALIGAGAVVITKCIDPKDVYKTIDWSILFLIFGMLGVSKGMEATGAAELIVENIVSFTDAYGPWILLASIYILTSFLTEIVSNNAVAALLTPIVIGVAASMGLDPKPFLVAVMFGASASFATPIGYQTNTFVYAAGGYKFRDFMKIGLPMNIIAFIVAMIVIPIFWPLE